MKRSQQCIFKLSSSIPETICELSMWPGMQFLLVQLIYILLFMLGKAFLTLSQWKSPHNTHFIHTYTYVTPNTHKQYCAQLEDGHSTRFTKIGSDWTYSYCTSYQLNAWLLSLRNKFRSKCSFSQCYFSRGPSSLNAEEILPGHNFQNSCQYSQWNEKKASLGHKTSRVSTSGTRRPLASEAEGRGVRHLGGPNHRARYTPTKPYSRDDPTPTYA